MGNRRIPVHILLIGVLLLSPMSVVWSATQKPANWLEWDTRLQTLGPDQATLTLTMTSAMPEASTSIHLNVPASMNALEGRQWQGTLTQHHTTQFQWTLTGPIDFTALVGITIQVTLPEGDMLDHHINAEWSNASTAPTSRTLAPVPVTQSRHGETLLVVPLTPEAQR